MLNFFVLHLKDTLDIIAKYCNGSHSTSFPLVPRMYMREEERKKTGTKKNAKNKFFLLFFYTLLTYLYVYNPDACTWIVMKIHAFSFFGKKTFLCREREEVEKKLSFVDKITFVFKRRYCFSYYFVTWKIFYPRLVIHIHIVIQIFQCCFFYFFNNLCLYPHKNYVQGRGNYIHLYI